MCAIWQIAKLLQQTDMPLTSRTTKWVNVHYLLLLFVYALRSHEDNS